MANTDSENFYRIVTLLVDGGTTVLRKHLSIIVQASGTTLQMYLQSKRRSINSLPSTVIHQEQVDKLFPPTGTTPPDITTFDLTLLCLLMTKICKVKSPKLDEVENLRMYRNEIYGHTAQASLDAKLFQKYWDDISDSILKLAKYSLDPNFITEIQSFINSTKTGVLQVSPCIELLKDWYTKDLPLLKQTITDVKDLQTGIQNLQQGHQQLQYVEREIEAMTTDLQDIKSETQDIRSNIAKDVSNIARDVDQLASRQQQLHKRVEATTSAATDVENIKSEISTVTSDVQRLTADIRKQQKLQNVVEKDISIVSSDVQTLELELSSIGSSVQVLQMDSKQHQQGVQKNMSSFRNDLEELKDDHHQLQQSTLTNVSQLHEDLQGTKRDIEMIQSQTTNRVSDVESQEQDLVRLKKQLIEFYTTSYSKVQVSPMNDELKVPINEIYTEVVIVKEEMERVQDGGRIDEKGRIERKEIPVKQYKQIFFKDRNRLKSVYLLASAGRGKTTWCYQLINTWCNAQRKKINIHDEIIYTRKNIKEDKRPSSYEDEKCMESFDFLFFVPLKHAAGKTSILEALFSTTLEQFSELHPVVIQVLQKCPEKVLIICDGLDEHASMPSREKLHGCTVVTTTRPWKYDTVKSSKYTAEILLELKGLDTKDIMTLSKRVLQSVYNISSEETVSECTNAIEKARMNETAQIPLLLTYIVHLWYRHKQLSPSIATTMIDVLVCVIETGTERLHGIIKITELEEKWKQAEIPSRMSDPAFDNYKGLLLSIAHLAFDGLMTPKKEEALLFRGNKLLNYFRHSPKEELEASLKLGVLSKSELPSVLRKETLVAFYHKMIQEFFAAVWIAISENAFAKFCEYCSDITSVNDMGNVYMFLCALAPELGSRFSRRVLKICAERQAAQKINEYDVQHPQLVEEPLDPSLRNLTDIQKKCWQELEMIISKSPVQLTVGYVDIRNGVFSKIEENFLLAIQESLLHLELHLIELPSIDAWYLLIKFIHQLGNVKVLKLRGIRVAGMKEEEIENEMPGEIATISTLESISLSYMHCPFHTLLVPLAKAHMDAEGVMIPASERTLKFLHINDIHITTSSWYRLMDVLIQLRGLQTLELYSISTHSVSWMRRYNTREELPRESAISSITISSLQKTSISTLLRYLAYTTATGRGNIIGVDVGHTATTLNRGTLTDLHLERTFLTMQDWRSLVTVVHRSNKLCTLTLKHIYRCGADDTVAVEDVPSMSGVQNIIAYKVNLPLLLLLKPLTKTIATEDKVINETEPLVVQSPTTVSTLKSLKIKDVKMTIDEWNSLIEILFQLKMLQTLNLQDIGTEDHSKAGFICRSMNAFGGLGDKRKLRLPVEFVLQDVTFDGIKFTLLPLLALVPLRPSVLLSGEENQCGETSNMYGSLAYLCIKVGKLSKMEWNQLTAIVSESPSLQKLHLDFRTYNDNVIEDESRSLNNLVKDAVKSKTLNNLTKDDVKSYNTFANDNHREGIELFQHSVQYVVIEGANSTQRCPVISLLLKRLINLSFRQSQPALSTLAHLGLTTMKMTKLEWSVLVKLINESSSLKFLYLERIDVEEDAEERSSCYADVNSFVQVTDEQLRADVWAKLQQNDSKTTPARKEKQNTNEGEDHGIRHEQAERDVHAFMVGNTALSTKHVMDDVTLKYISCSFTPLMPTISMSEGLKYLCIKNRTGILDCIHELFSAIKIMHQLKWLTLDLNTKVSQTLDLSRNKSLQTLQLMHIEFGSHTLDLSQNSSLEILKLKAVQMLPECWTKFSDSIHNLQSLRFLNFSLHPTVESLIKQPAHFIRNRR